jgi:glycosyltransferase involved in cell wall biosynthesis
MHRHLNDSGRIRLWVPQNERHRWHPALWRRRAGTLLARGGLRVRGEELLLGGKGVWYAPEIPNTAEFDIDLVLTVAHGDLWWCARRYADRIGRPLVTVFHDWWPDLAQVGRSMRRRLDAEFRDLYQASDLALCVSPGMLAELGPHANAHVLYPIPEKPQSGVTTSISNDGKFRVIYAGNLHEYGPMLQALLERLTDHPTIRLEVRGSRPAWTAGFQERMRVRGCWLPFAERDQLEEWLAGADAFLVPQVFEDTRRRLMRTNFPSKIPEMAQFRKPLILWAPFDASSPVWQRETHAALSVSDPDPSALVRALEELAASAQQRTNLARAAGQVAQTMFDPQAMQRQFIELLLRTIHPDSATPTDSNQRLLSQRSVVS